MKAQDSFGSSGRAPDEKDSRMRPAQSEAAPSAPASGHSYGENCRKCEGGYCLAFPNWSKKE